MSEGPHITAASRDSVLLLPSYRFIPPPLPRERETNRYAHHYLACLPLPFFFPSSHIRERKLLTIHISVLYPFSFPCRGKGNGRVLRVVGHNSFPSLTHPLTPISIPSLFSSLPCLSHREDVRSIMCYSDEFTVLLFRLASSRHYRISSAS